ncbi:MAG: protein translocase subunit SecD [Gammaproteobacteria bacterium]|jgi:preprotein translocase subunit SecD|nr:protein translocase subunit SecD [Gammaproteobacteria bacterium]
MNHYPWWKNLMVVLVVAVGGLLALPNLFGEDPAIQIARDDYQPVSEATVTRVRELLQRENLVNRGVFSEDGRVQVRFEGVETQLQAHDLLKEELGSTYGTALTMAPRTPAWLRAIGLRPMSLGLDLRGGVHFLYEVDIQGAVTQTLQRYESDFKAMLRKEDIRYVRVREQNGTVEVVLRDQADADAARELVRDSDPQLQVLESMDGGNVVLTVSMTEQQIRQRQDFAIEQNVTTLRNRVNEIGVAEPVVQRQGLDRIVVQLPGVQDSTRAKKVLGATATLEFRLVDLEGDAYQAKRTGRVPLNAILLENRQGQPILLSRDVIVTGDQLTDASSGFSEGSAVVHVRLDAKGARKMLETTKRNLDKPMAVVFIERKRETVERDGEQVDVDTTEQTVINTATIRGVFSSNFQIEGLTPFESRDLALLLRAGSLAAPIYIVEERTIGPSLGQANIDQGFEAVAVGFLVVVLFMAIYYKAFGLVADLALMMNVVLLVALLSLLQASLTLPGIAGIVLTVGMAVDANVLIFERIREELRGGNTPQAAIHAGYDKAFSSIADANVTTLIAAVVLFAFGTGPIKGFAITLSLGIITSMFTAIVGTRAVVNLIYGSRKLKSLAI